MLRIDALRAEESRLRSAMSTIEEAAVTAVRDLTEDEENELGHLRTSYDACAANILEVGTQLASQAATAEILARIAPAPAVVARVTHEPAPAMTPGEYATTYIRSVDPRNTATEREEASTLLRTIFETGTGDTPGILPTPIIGELVKFVDASRPLVNSMRPMPMPAKGKTFTRPRLTASTLSAVQTEKSALSSRQLTTIGDTVTKATHGTVLNLTEQDIDWSEPSLFDIVYEDMAEQYAIDTEDTAATAVEALITSNVVSFDIATADAGDITPALAAAAAATYSTAKTLPDTIYAAVNVWAFLAGLVDGDDRPLYPNLNPVNASGTIELTSFAGNPMGLKLVVSPQFSDNFFAVAASRKLEVYEQNKGFTQIGVPSLLEVQVAYRGYFATNLYAQGITGLE